MLNSLKAIELLKRRTAANETKNSAHKNSFPRKPLACHSRTTPLGGDAQRIQISLATVYNALNSFKEAGIVKQVLVEPGKIYFDTNTESHHHFYIEETGELVDVPDDECKIVFALIPAEYTVNQVEITIRLEKTKEADPRSRN